MHLFYSFPQTALLLTLLLLCALGIHNLKTRPLNSSLGQLLRVLNNKTILVRWLLTTATTMNPRTHLFRPRTRWLLIIMNSSAQADKSQRFIRSTVVVALCQRLLVGVRPGNYLLRLIACGACLHLLSSAAGAPTLPNRHQHHNRWYYLRNVHRTDSQTHKKLHNSLLSALPRHHRNPFSARILLLLLTRWYPMTAVFLALAFGRIPALNPAIPGKHSRS